MASAILHGGGVAAAAALYGGDPVDWLDLSTGLNPLPPELPVLAPRIWHRLPDADLLIATRQSAAASIPVPVTGVAGTRVTSRPPMRICPPLTVSSPAIILSTVDLPQPDDPTSTTNSPAATSRSMPRIVSTPS